MNTAEIKKLHLLYLSRLEKSMREQKKAAQEQELCRNAIDVLFGLSVLDDQKRSDFLQANPHKYADILPPSTLVPPLKTDMNPAWLVATTPINRPSNMS